LPTQQDIISCEKPCATLNTIDNVCSTVFYINTPTTAANNGWVRQTDTNSKCKTSGGWGRGAAYSGRWFDFDGDGKLGTWG
jgi:hypothetical protein